MQSSLPTQNELTKLSTKINKRVIKYIAKYFAKDYKWINLNKDDFNITLQRINDRKIKVTVITGRYTKYAPFTVFAPLLLLANIEQKLGDIDKFEINGSFYKPWQPWKNRRTLLGNNYSDTI